MCLSKLSKRGKTQGFRYNTLYWGDYAEFFPHNHKLYRRRGVGDAYRKCEPRTRDLARRARRSLSTLEAGELGLGTRGILGASARTPSGLPQEVLRVLAAHESFANPVLLIGVVEHRVNLDTTKTPSQNDIWCLLGTDSGHVSVAVEGKAGEDFDRRLGDWLKSDGDGKERRLAFLCGVLGAAQRPDVGLRYQLLHRAATAVLEAKRWRLPSALMHVQSFRESKTAWNDYSDFAEFLGLQVSRDSVSGPVRTSGVDLYLAWVNCDVSKDSDAAAAV